MVVVVLLVQGQVIVSLVSCVDGVRHRYFFPPQVTHLISIGNHGRCVNIPDYVVPIFIIVQLVVAVDVHQLLINQQICFTLILSEHHLVDSDTIFVVIFGLVYGVGLAWNSCDVLVGQVVLDFVVAVGSDFVTRFVQEYADV